MQSGTQNLAHDQEANASQSYRKTLATPPVPHDFERAILMLVPTRKHREICALFDNRVAYGTIKHWRRGRRDPPQWARDLLAARLEQDARECAVLAELCREQARQAAIYESAHYRSRNIRAYNRDRASLTPEKKKGAD